MYYVRNRLLLPCIGAWNRRDPVGYVDGMNLFAIASPVKLTDPQGTFPQEAVANRPCNRPPAVYLQTHHVKSGNHHLSILIVPNDGGQHLRQHFPNVPLVPLPHYPSQLRDRTGLTLGAGPSALLDPEVEADFNRWRSACKSDPPYWAVESACLMGRFEVKDVDGGQIRSDTSRSSGRDEHSRDCTSVSSFALQSSRSPARQAGPEVRDK